MQFQAISYDCRKVPFHSYHTFCYHLHLCHRCMYFIRLFPVGETKGLQTLSAKIHGYGSVIGFLLFVFAPLLTGLYFFKIPNRFLGVFSLICFTFSLLCFALFVMADKPAFQGSIIAFEGLWQRLSLLCMYLPIIALCITKNTIRLH